MKRGGWGWRRDGWKDLKDMYSVFEVVKWFLHIYNVRHLKHIGALDAHICIYIHGCDHTCMHRHTLLTYQYC